MSLNKTSIDKMFESAYQIPGWCWPRELHALHNLAKDSKCHVEIGAYCGKSVWAFAHGMPKGSSIHTVDPSEYLLYTEMVEAFSVPSEEWAFKVLNATLDALRASRPDLNVKHHKEISITTALRFQERGIKTDSVYIDAGYHYEDTISDIQLWMPLINPGGIICGHDYCTREPGVIEAVNEEFANDFHVLEHTRIWVHKVK